MFIATLDAGLSRHFGNDDVKRGKIGLIGYLEGTTRIYVVLYSERLISYFCADLGRTTDRHESAVADEESKNRLESQPTRP